MWNLFSGWTRNSGERGVGGERLVRIEDTTLEHMSKQASKQASKQ